MNDARIDRLYELLPVIYRMRDAEQGEPLKALLQVITEQVNLVEDDIQQLYENWFIETCEDWAVPYLGDLIGYESVHEAGEPSPGKTTQGQLRNKALIPRREVANTIRYRRRKGSLALLEQLSNDVAGWPARAVEFYKLLSWTQALNHLYLDRGRTVDIRNNSALELIDSPFDSIAHSVDVRRIHSRYNQGRHNIPSVGVFVWRLKSYSVTETPAYCLQETVGPDCFTFSILGNDSPLYLNPDPEPDPTHIAAEINLPVPIRRRLFQERMKQLYGKDKSLQIWLRVKRRNKTVQELVPPERIIAADLSAWNYFPPKNHVAVDPVLGRITLPSINRPSKRGAPNKRDVLVKYHYGFSSELGGGEYDRELSQPALHTLYRVGAGETFQTINAAINQWRLEQGQGSQEQGIAQQKLANAVIEIMDSGLYEEDFNIKLQAGESLQIRSAKGKHAVIGLSDNSRSQAEYFSVQVARGSCLTLDGLTVVGRPVEICPPIESWEDNEQPGREVEESQEKLLVPKQTDIIIRHTTLVPGWDLIAECKPKEKTVPSLKLLVAHLCVKIEHSIVGSIEVDPAAQLLLETEDGQKNDVTDEEAVQANCRRIEQLVRLDPIRICISDSILDAIDSEFEVIHAPIPANNMNDTPGCLFAHARLTILRTTVFGQIQVHAIELGENVIFNGRIAVARRQQGCLRFCYVTPESRTPRRYRCQPDLVERAEEARLIQEAEKQNGESKPDQDIINAAKIQERLRVRPIFNSMRYGTPTYCQLAECSAEEIKRGADDESEMGVFHDLFQPQRMANLRVRLDEYVPVGEDVGIIIAS